MRKGSLRTLLYMTLFTIILTGCAGKTTRQTDSVTADTEHVEVADTQTEKMTILDMEDAYEEILGFCTKEFIGNHLVDESFLNWIYAKYGDTAIRSIEKEVKKDNPDVNLWYELTGESIHVLWLDYCASTGFQQYELSNVYWKECASEDKIVLDFTGDINFAEDWYTTEHMDAQANGIYDCISADLIEKMKAADVLLVNNEFVYSNRGTPLAGKDYTFRASPEREKLLATFGTDIVSLANNHVYDYGEEALLDTLDTLEADDMPYVGAGRNIEEASQPVYFVANGRKIAIVAATQIERSTNFTKEATEDSAGVLKTLDATKFVKEIVAAKKNSDYVIVYVHWGTEGNANYDAGQTGLAMQYVAAGADAIIGSHTHCLQGISFVEDVPVFYSLGNFWFSTGTMNTGMAEIEIDKEGALRMRYVPCLQKGIATSLVTDENSRQEMMSYLNSISTDVVIDENGYVYNSADGQNQEMEQEIEILRKQYEKEYEDSQSQDLNSIGNLRTS